MALPEALLRKLYIDLDLTDRDIAKRVGVKRDTVAKMRSFYGIPKSLKLKGSLEWHRTRSMASKQIAAKKNWERRRRDGTAKTGRVPSSAFKPGNDNGRLNKTLEELFGEERARELKIRIANKLRGRFAGKNAAMYGKEPMNKKNHHRGGYVESPLQGVVWMRSSWEIEYANHLTRKGIRWLYEPKRFELNTNFTYRPDFYLPDYLPDSDEWKEVKGYMTERDYDKIEAMQTVHGIRVAVISWDEMRALGLRLRPKKLVSSTQEP